MFMCMPGLFERLGTDASSVANAPASYGFTIHDNPYLGVDYWVKVPPTARDAEWKTNLLHSHPLTSNQTYDFAGTLRPGKTPVDLCTMFLVDLTTHSSCETERIRATCG